MKHHLKHWFYPHEKNNHRPHALRHSALAVYAIGLLAFHFFYNVSIAQTGSVLGFATAVSQSELISLTNQERSEAGLGTLAESAALNKSAQLKAKNMFDENYWAHYAPSGKSPWYWYDQAGYSYTLAGENLARDFDTSAGVIQGWMNSPTHRANMLAPGYKEIGIAVMNGILQGHETTLIVQHFGTPVVLAAATNQTPQPTQATTQPAPTATPVMVEERQITTQIQPTVATGAPGVPSLSLDRLGSLPYQLLNPNPITTWGLQQIVTAVFLFCLMLLFVFDSAVLLKKGLPRLHSHSMLHAGALAVLLVLVLYSTMGSVI
jgi:uncharacterized protein YkwD